MKHLHFDVETDGFYGAYWACKDGSDCAVIAMLGDDPEDYMARSLFKKYKKCTDIYCALWQSGLKLEQLAVAGNGVPAHVRCVQAQLRREACGTVRLLRLGRWRGDAYLGE